MDMQELGAEIQLARRQRQLTQVDIANALKMSHATISQIESGKVDEIGIRKVMRVMDYVGLELIARPARHGYTLEDAIQDNNTKQRIRP